MWRHSLLQYPFPHNFCPTCLSFSPHRNEINISKGPSTCRRKQGGSPDSRSTRAKPRFPDNKPSLGNALNEIFKSNICFHSITSTPEACAWEMGAVGLSKIRGLCSFVWRQSQALPFPPQGTTVTR